MSEKAEHTMVNQCANTTCGKPLHYLREGRIFIFDMPDPDAPTANGRTARRLQHFWLCGSCSESLAMEQTSDQQIRVVMRKGKLPVTPGDMLPGRLAS